MSETAMPRQERIVEPGLYHIINRGVERRNIFHHHDDYEFFSDLLLILTKEYGVTIHTYALMTNHYHILLETTQNNLSKAIQFLNDKYAKYFNKKYKRVGHLWQGRFKSYALYDDAHFWIVAKYIERNPIKAHIVQSVEQYKYQSYFQWSTKLKYYELINNSKIFDMTLEEYKAYLSTDLEVDAIEIVYDSPKLVKKDGKLKILVKRLETFFETDRDINRNNNIMKAYKYGYKKSEIARFLDLHPSVVSKRIEKERVKNL
jgi:REP element-mobilizing transposase RayT